MREFPKPIPFYLIDNSLEDTIFQPQGGCFNTEVRLWGACGFLAAQSKRAIKFDNNQELYHA